VLKSVHRKEKVCARPRLTGRIGWHAAKGFAGLFAELLATTARDRSTLRMTAAALPHMQEGGGRFESPGRIPRALSFSGAGDGATAVGPLVNVRQGSFLFGLPSTSSSETHEVLHARCNGAQ
jgi:hypothetical protein